MARYLFLLLLTIASTSWAGLFSNDATGPLPAHEAIQFTSEQNQQTLIISFTLADNIYLYRDKFAVQLLDKTPYPHATFAEQAETISDPNFGDVAVFYYAATANIDLSQLPTYTQQLKIRYQGCDEAIGLCYPPQTAVLDIESFTASTPAVNNTAAKDTSLNQASGILGFLQNAGLALILATFLVLGMGLTFTPCVLPMMPIISSIIAGQKHLTPKRGFVLSSIYVLGMAITYAVAGVVVGSLGASFNIQIYMQQPWVLSIFAVLFVLLSLAMFGVYELRLPRFIQDPIDRLNQKQQGGSLISVLLMGALSAIVVSPCVSAPLAGALLYISSTGDAVLGGLALFALGLGMGLPLIIIGTTGAYVLPKAGPWMDAVKHFFGVLLLAVAWWLLGRFIPETLYMSGWIALLGIYTVMLGAFEPAHGYGKRFIKALALLGFVFASALLFKLVLGSTQVSRPNIDSTNSEVISKKDRFFEVTSSNSELQQKLSNAKANEKLVFVDVYADWCIECKIMSNTLFKDAEVRDELSHFVRIKYDMTDFTDEHKAFLEQHNLFGPPALLFFGLNGDALPEAHIIGDIKKAEFLRHLQQFDH
ncbi:MAG: protein-disulfide reductase DsbD [Gammaproteobacteria bacterium]|nr:protein-disulfide reductase DsbD [Gammaproteobacteria bacterium]